LESQKSVRALWPEKEGESDFSRSVEAWENLLLPRIARPVAAKAAEDAAVATAAGKPVQSPEIVAKRIEGGVQKYLKEVSLFNQPFVKNDKQTVEQMLKEKGTTVKAFTLYVVGEGIEKKVDDFAAEVAAQVAAAKAA
jgi:elongation factor Ts